MAQPASKRLVTEDRVESVLPARLSPEGLSASTGLQIKDAVPPAVSTALAANNAPAQAAAAAVSTALGQAGILKDAYPNDDPGVIVSITDSGGRRSWLEVGPDGGPTPHAKSKIGAPADLDPLTSLIYAVTDTTDRVAFGVDTTGGFVIRKLAAETKTLLGISTGPLLCPGDSMTAGAGGTPYTDGLSADLAGREVIQFGYGGQGARSITARTGAHPVMVTLTDDTIPASGAVTITGRDGNLDAGTYLGSLCGIPGTMTVTGANAMTFTRTTAGTATACPPNTPFVTRPDFRGLQVVSWMGRNGGFVDQAAIDTTILETRHALAWAGRNAARSLVLSVVPFAGDTATQLALLASLNNALRQAFPAQFVDVAARMRSVTALAEEGITATAQDQSDIANGLTPTSFRSDGGHFNTIGYRRVRRIVSTELTARGAA